MRIDAREQSNRERTKNRELYRLKVRNQGIIVLSKIRDHAYCNWNIRNSARECCPLIENIGYMYCKRPVCMAQREQSKTYWLREAAGCSLISNKCKTIK